MKNVIIDKDGVIFDTERLAVQCWKTLADEYRFPDIERIYPLFVGKTRADVEKTIRDNSDPDFPCHEMTERFYEMLSETIDRYGPPVKPFARELLVFLKDNGYQVALASSAHVREIRKELAMARLDGYFDVVVGGDMAARGKPAPDIFLMACRLLNCKPQDAFAIEDSENGIRSARAAGTHPIMVPDLIAPSREIRETCDCVCQNLYEAQLFISRKNSAGES